MISSKRLKLIQSSFQQPKPLLIPPISDLVPVIDNDVLIYSSMNSAAILFPLRLLPQKIEREIGKLLSTLGFKQAGACVWNSSNKRTSKFQILAIDPNWFRMRGVKALYGEIAKRDDAGKKEKESP